MISDDGQLGTCQLGDIRRDVVPNGQDVSAGRTFEHLSIKGGVMVGRWSIKGNSTNKGHSCNIGNAPNFVGKKIENIDLCVLDVYLIWNYIH